jgi:hypothetical protein
MPIDGTPRMTVLESEWEFPFVLSEWGPWKAGSDGDLLISNLRLYSSDGRFTGGGEHVFE